MILLLERILVLGLLGMLIECVFTGVKSLLSKNWHLTCRTSLWMWIIYGVAGVTLNFLHDKLGLHPFWAACVYVPVMYAFEFGSGWLMKKLMGSVFWDYGFHKYSIMGLIRVDYLPYWFILALCFDSIANYLNKILHLIGTI